MSFIVHGDIDAEVKGLDQIPRSDWPNVSAVFQTYHLMILMWVLMVFTAVIAWVMWWRGTLYKSPMVLRWTAFSVLFPQIGNQAGWVSAEMGRYPWIVQGLLRVSEGLSKSVKAEHILGSIIMFGIVYFLLFILFIYLLNEKIQHGPSDEDLASPYHNLNVLVEEIKDGSVKQS